MERRKKRTSNTGSEKWENYWLNFSWNCFKKCQCLAEFGCLFYMLWVFKYSIFLRWGKLFPQKNVLQSPLLSKSCLVIINTWSICLHEYDNCFIVLGRNIFSRVLFTFNVKCTMYGARGEKAIHLQFSSTLVQCLLFIFLTFLRYYCIYGYLNTLSDTNCHTGEGISHTTLQIVMSWR